ncbi:hypothetical protein RintRC_5369 [Richelia intracellularis]|nr:hypothetical protein RintRC_5369 [Richelia intracellularis]
MKQFILGLMWSGDGDIPLYLRVEDGNGVDCAMFGTHTYGRFPETMAN